MRIDNYHALSKGYMVAYFDAILPVKWGNLRLRGMRLFQKNGKRWISFSSKMVQQDGEKKYYPNEVFEDARSMTEFSKDILKAIDDHALENSHQKVEQKVEQKELQYQHEEIPF